MVDNFMEQLRNGDFRPASFSVFNFIDNDGFLTELYAIDKVNYDIDDFEYLNFSLTDDIKNGIKHGKKTIMKDITDFKKKVDDMLPDNEKKIKVYPIKYSGSLIAVKLKSFSLFNEPDN